LPDAAIEVLTGVGRRRDDRHDHLLRQIRYDRAELFERVGRKAQARRELEKPYAEAPEFGGLTERLGLSWPGRWEGGKRTFAASNTTNHCAQKEDLSATLFQEVRQLHVLAAGFFLVDRDSFLLCRKDGKKTRHWPQTGAKIVSDAARGPSSVHRW